jgi:hypothetical protein
LVTGTPGAGKSTFIKSAFEGSFDIATIFEGQLADFAATKIKIDQIVEKGLRPEIFVVHAKAENALDNALLRFEQVGRGASIDLIANLLSRLPQSLAEVHKTYGDAVKLTIIDRRDVDNPLITLSWDNLPTLSSEGTYEHIKERLSKHLEERYQSGSISRANYEQARGRAPIRPSIGIRQTRGSGLEADEQRSAVSQEDARKQLLDPDAAPTLGAGRLNLASPILAPVSLEDLRQYGQALQALDFPSQNVFDSYRVFAFHEASEQPLEIFDLDVINRYTHDQLLTLPINFNPSPAPEADSDRDLPPTPELNLGTNDPNATNTPNTANPITDFGQKIGGARKDAWTGYLDRLPAIRALHNEPRLGIDYRGDQNITPQEFNDVFGFRGVEFGNWVEQGRRQSDLNEAYDALMDLSKALALPPAALSLNGELGLAFGARGRGGVDPAKAHYEAGHVVINLTKEKGAGSLAHEWWHALDNYLVRTHKPQSPLGFVSENLRAVNLRHALQESFVQVMEQIRLSNLPARSAKMDEHRSSAYWATPIEMSARCFEGITSSSATRNARTSILKRFYRFLVLKRGLM